MTTADLRHAELLASLPEEWISIIVDAGLKASERAIRDTTRLLARYARKLRDDKTESESVRP
jgi:hypothetical protein